MYQCVVNALAPKYIYNMYFEVKVYTTRSLSKELVGAKVGWVASSIKELMFHALGNGL